MDNYNYEDMDLSDKKLQNSFPNNYKIYLNIKKYDNSNGVIPIVHNLYNINSKNTEYIFVNQMEIKKKN